MEIGIYQLKIGQLEVDTFSREKSGDWEIANREIGKWRLESGDWKVEKRKVEIGK